MGKLLEQIGNYWNKRAPSYSAGLFSDFEIKVWREVFRKELPEKHCRILDIGTGPGFFAWLLASEGHEVTAVDYTEGMLEQARMNAGILKEKITFLQMDAQNLTFPDNTFDVVVNRNVTWNLEDPQKAYHEWQRVLKPGGMLMVFDAPWYEYLYDKTMEKDYINDRDRTKEAGLVDESISYGDSPVMENISRELYFSKCHRPAADFCLLQNAGFEGTMADTEFWKRVWNDDEKIMYASTPMFMIKTKKKDEERINEKDSCSTLLRSLDSVDVRMREFRHQPADNSCVIESA